MAFIPATPGIVGFGGGNKPAIFQAVAPQYSLMNQQSEDEDFRKCHELFGDTLQSANSGITDCGDCYTIDPGGGPQDVRFSFTGVNGLFTLTWNAISSAWEAVIGTATVSIFPSGDGSCTGASTDFTADVLEQVICNGANSMSVRLLATTVIGMLLFSNTGGTTFPDPVVNLNLVGDCGTGSGAVFATAYAGIITLSL